MNDTKESYDELPHSSASRLIELQNPSPYSLPDSNMSLRWDGGECCLHKEDDPELGAWARVPAVVAVEKVPSMPQALHTIVGGLPAESSPAIDCYFDKADRQICLSAKDGSL